MKLKKILVATDLSEAADSVHRWAAALAGRFGGRITLLNVDETSRFDWLAPNLYSSGRLKDFLAELSGSRRERLGQALSWLEEHHPDTLATVRSAKGRASDEILEASREYDLVVVGRRGAGQTESSGLGSTAKRLLRRVRVPTLVVPREPPATEPLAKRRIVAATTFSAACMMSLDATVALAETLDARIDAVHVIRLPVPFSITPTDWPEIVGRETREELRHMQANGLSEYMGEQRAGRCTPYTTVGTSVSTALRDLALEIGVDLITIPSHSGSDDSPPRFGSTTENVIKRSAVPVLVFPVRYLERRFGMASE